MRKQFWDPNVHGQRRFASINYTSWLIKSPKQMRSQDMNSHPKQPEDAVIAAISVEPEISSCIYSQITASYGSNSP